ncbi:MAG: hypothetical protein ISS36_01025 [Candidatus Aenigmarchaeota archaeon]|nr:hypothetical protein [Candidatus Aenigmarchaeota archaeon]
MSYNARDICEYVDETLNGSTIRDLGIEAGTQFCKRLRKSLPSSVPPFLVEEDIRELYGGEVPERLSGALANTGEKIAPSIGFCDYDADILKRLIVSIVE